MPRRAKPTAGAAKRRTAPRRTAAQTREHEQWKRQAYGEARRIVTRLRAKYDAAQRTEENYKHWSNADRLGPREANTKAVREVLRTRSRYERDNNSYCHGMTSTLAMDCIGTGPRLKLIESFEDIEDRDELDQAVRQDLLKQHMQQRRAFRQINREFCFWCEHVDLPGKLKILDLCAIVDGEGFALLTDNPAIFEATGEKVGLDLRVIECDYVTDNAVSLNLNAPKNNVDGILFDKHGNPAKYRVLREHPGDGGYLTNDADWIDARNVLHWFKPFRAGQVRGVPEYTPSLPLFAQLRRYTLAVLMAAEAASEIAAFIQTNMPPSGVADTDNTDVMDLFEFVRGMVLTLPEGWTVGQLNPGTPTTGYGEFADRILREIARCLDMPWGLASGDSSQYNYASGRLDIQVYVRRIQCRRRALERLLNRIFQAWFEEARSVKGYLQLEGLPPFAEWRWAWHWDGFGHVDPTKEASALQTLLESNAISLTEWCAINGRDFEEVAAQIAKDKAKLEKLGLAMPQRTSNPAADVRRAPEPVDDAADAEEVVYAPAP